MYKWGTLLKKSCTLSKDARLEKNIACFIGEILIGFD